MRFKPYPGDYQQRRRYCQHNAKQRQLFLTSAFPQRSSRKCADAGGRDGEGGQNNSHLKVAEVAGKDGKDSQGCADRNGDN